MMDRKDRRLQHVRLEDVTDWTGEDNHTEGDKQSQHSVHLNWDYDTDRDERQSMENTDAGRGRETKDARYREENYRYSDISNERRHDQESRDRKPGEWENGRRDTWDQRSHSVEPDNWRESDWGSDNRGRNEGKKNKKNRRKSKGKIAALAVVLIAVVGGAGAFAAYHFLQPVTYTVTFDPDDGTVVSGELEQVVQEGNKPEVPKLERDGYEFTGWDPQVSAADENVTYTAEWKKKTLDPEELYKKAMDSVVEIHTIDGTASQTTLGSGFFIDDKGTFITNYHVIEGAAYIEAQMADGGTYAVPTVVGWSEDLDLAILQCDIRESKPLTISDEDVETGEKVYTIGSSLGLTGTLSDGLVGNANRTIEGKNCIQVTAPISQGNSGGPLMNENGEVIGINTMGAADGQNLNFAIKASEIDKVNTSSPVSVKDFYQMTQQNSTPTPTAEPTVTPDPTATPEPTQNANQSNGEQWVYQNEDSHEKEPNDSKDVSDILENGEVKGGYYGVGGEDWYTFTVDEDTEADIEVDYYVDDDAYATDVTLWNASMTEQESVDTASDEGTAFTFGNFQIAAGTYYICVKSGDNHTADRGSNYLLCVKW